MFNALYKIVDGKKYVGIIPTKPIYPGEYINQISCYQGTGIPLVMSSDYVSELSLGVAPHFMEPERVYFISEPSKVDCIAYLERCLKL